MTLDETNYHFHIRECDNRVRVSVSITNSGTRVFYEQRVEIDSKTYRWQPIATHSVRVFLGRSWEDAAQRLYDDGPERFGRDGQLKATA